jgi:hypothetical protein
MIEGGREKTQATTALNTGSRTKTVRYKGLLCDRISDTLLGLIGRKWLCSKPARTSASKVQEPLIGHNARV